MKGEHPVQVAELQHPADPITGHDEPKVTVEEPNPLERTHQHTQTERVDIVDAGQVEHQVMIAGADFFHHVLAEFRRADDVEFAGDGEDSPTIVAVRVHDEIHPIDRIGPHACDSVTRVP